MECPACGGKAFSSFNGRRNAFCMRCGSLERGRLQYMILRELDLPRPHSRVLHIAPEWHLCRYISARCAETYFAVDNDSTHIRFSKFDVPIQHFDMCSDFFALPQNSFDLILHNHVLEHLPCDIVRVLIEHKRVLAPGGYFLFSVPFKPGISDEDYVSNLSDDERVERFKQKDHMRIFGDLDFPILLKKVFGQELRFDTTVWADEFLLRHAIPPEDTRTFTGTTNFLYHKPESTT